MLTSRRPGLAALAILSTRLPFPAATAVSVAGGLCVWLAFPDLNIWPLAPVGVALFALAVRGQRARVGALLGFLAGLAYFLPLLHWSGVYVGTLPWVALSVLQALYVALLGLVLPAAWRTRAAPLAIAGLWVAQEALRDRTPYGGFPWARLAFSQSDAPTLHLAALGGAPLVTFAVALAGALVATALVHVRRPGIGLVIAATGLAVMAAGLLVPLPTGGRTIQVAGVQGDVPKAGLDFDAQRAAVLDLHAKGTDLLAAQVAAGQRVQPDIVIWPENASDLDPYQQPDARAVIDAAVAGAKVPTLVGAVLDSPPGRLSNVSIVWTPGAGPGEQYVKRHPVPFGEYIPSRDFFRHFSSKVDLVGRDFVAGDKVGILQLGPAKVGVAICFEVAYDSLLRDSVDRGADLLVVQTNNATFGYTDEAAQQLAMSRLRAVEHGRSVAHISTVGISALIAPDGRVLQDSKLFTPALLQAALPLRTSVTVSDRLGVWPEVALVLLGLFGCTAGGLKGRRRRDSVTE
ncbi:MAG: apolipoprotein N-acyltransferase [Actinomycetota bacterium]|nr:apolipoprotein N-acyltransferase [Actinomycetota bacterium]